MSAAVAALPGVHVFVHVKPGREAAFVEATLANARGSVQEKGIARFDVLQQADDPARFVLVEMYEDARAPAAHKETAHYAAWRDAVADWMAEPRSAKKCDAPRCARGAAARARDPAPLRRVAATPGTSACCRRAAPLGTCPPCSPAAAPRATRR